MRTIKFRGLRTDGKGWVYGYYFKAGRTQQHAIRVSESGGVLVDQVFEVKPETVGQFTGLTDRDGKEIWEGDLVRYHFQNSWCKAEMIFNDGAFRIRGWSHGQLTHTFEVAGNIHEQ